MNKKLIPSFFFLACYPSSSGYDGLMWDGFAGKIWSHKFVYVLRFNVHAQIYKIRAYCDTLHCWSDIDEPHKMKSGGK